MKEKAFYQRNAFRIFLAAIFIMPIALRRARFAAERTKNDVKSWLPAGFEETKQLVWFRNYFMGEQFVVMSWKGCTLDDPRVEVLAHKLEHPDQQHAADVRKYVKQVTTGPRVLEQMTAPNGPLGLKREEALRRLDGSLVGKDGETTCVLVTLTNESIEEFREVLGRSRPLTEILMGREDGVLLQVAAASGIPKHDLILGGPPVDNVAIDDEGEITLLRLVGLSGLVGLIMSYWCFRSYRVTMMVFSCGVYGAAASLAIVYFTGGVCDAVLMSMPSLVYVLGLSGAIHLVNYYKDAVRESGTQGACESAVRHGWLPCTLAAVTTALGLASLITSEIVPIAKFGKYSALGVLFTLSILFSLLPSFLAMWGLKAKRKNISDNESDKPTENPVAAPATHSKWNDRLMVGGDWIIRRNGLVATSCLLLMLTLAYGITKIETSVHLLKLFSSEVDIIQDYTWLEEHLGNLVPMEVVVRVAPERQRASDEDLMTADGRYRMTFLERMEMVEKVQRSIERLPEVGKALSMITFAPNLPEEATGFSAFAERSAFNAGLQGHIDDFLREDYFRIADDGEELYRVSARLAALSDVDYGQFVDEIKGAVEPILSAYHLRDEILAALSDPNESLRKKKVCIIGVPRSDADDEPGANKKIRPGSETMAETLLDLMRVAGVGVRPIHKAAADFVPKHVVTADEDNPKAAKYFSQFDVVVIADDHPSFQYGFIARHADNLIDARTPESFGANDADAPSGGLTAVYTGVVPLVYKAQRTLLSGLVESIGLAFVLICIVMISILRSPSAGLLSMLPNVFPVMVIFGAMGWLGIYVDIGTMMCASVAMGVAVDDTVHFLTWFRRGILQGLDRQGAVRLAYERCATAMIQTTIIGGLGLAVFGFSTFTPTQRFGLLMLILLSTALVGDLVFLPALLSGPIGRFFTGRLQKQAEAKSMISDPAADEPTTAEPIPAPHFAGQPSRSPHKTTSDHRMDR